MPSIQTREIVTADHKFSHEIMDKASKAGLEAIEKLFNIENLATDFADVEEFINEVIKDTKTFGIAQHLIQDLTGFTENLNKQIDKSKPLFGGVPKHVQSKSEIVRLIWLAYWLRTMVDELNKEAK